METRVIANNEKQKCDWCGETPPKLYEFKTPIGMRKNLCESCYRYLGKEEAK